METFTCPECQTTGIVAVTLGGKVIVSPCDCVAKEESK